MTTQPDAALVRKLASDMLTGETLRPLDTSPASLADAYAIQDAVVAHLLDSDARAGVGGFKIAANSAALMERFGIDEPASGHIFSDEIQQAPASRPASDFAEFAYEPEIAAVMGARLVPDNAPFSAEEVAEAIDRFVPSLELLDMRNIDMAAVPFLAVLAQNITNAGAVLGGEGIKPSLIDTDRIHTTVTINGEPELDVTGAAPQSPVEAVRWLANHLAERGMGLEPGQIVLCGTHAPIRKVKGPAVIRVEMSGLGSLEYEVTG
ncbi:hypothetical protein E0K89_002745 [Aquicoccus sp. SCR17]|nr:hypothetical protein [Carideicomes alvinocaridis]